VFVHGDLAPVNVILAPDGAIRALLDVEHAALGSPAADAAWWGWVVRHHHPEAWSASWPTFLEAAGLVAGDGDGLTRRALRATMLVRLLSSVVDASDVATRGRWAARLDEAAAW
jgi:aminoglycoside phosphotransferase (APT) family kinase protein